MTPFVQVQIELADVKPRVWRRLIVPADRRMDEFARILLTAMGWNDSHLHAFRIGDVLYGMHLEDFPDDEVDEATVTIAKAVFDHDRFLFEYDYGDGWEHKVVVEAAGQLDVPLRFAVCVAGANACPLDDCGGPWGYANLLKVLADPKHPEHVELLQWAGGPIDPAEFSLAAVNADLQYVH